MPYILTIDNGPAAHRTRENEMTDLKLYTATISNRFFYSTVATMAPSRDAAVERFASYAASDVFLNAAEAERGNWISELGEYPGDDAYAYSLRDSSVEEDGFLSSLTREYEETILSDTTGTVFDTGGGSNG